MVFGQHKVKNILKKTGFLHLVLLLVVYVLIINVLSARALSLDPAYENGTGYENVSWCGGGSGDYRTYCRRNCTSYVAYRFANLGVSATHYMNNGKDWYSRAKDKGIPTGSVAKVGAVAYWTTGGGGYGHVGWVDSVNSDGSANTSNYNGLTMEFYTQSNVRPEGYIYFSNVGNEPQLRKMSSDFNADGKDDIAWYEQWNQGKVTGFISGGSSFATKSLLSGMGKPTWAGVGDFDGDKRSDFAWYEESTRTINISRGTPESGYGTATKISGIGKPDWAPGISY